MRPAAGTAVRSSAVALPRLTAPAYRRICVAALLSLGVIVVTGALVRLTGSGLGCTDWPTCYEDQFHAELEYHALIEFGNRLFTGVVSLAVIFAVLGSLLVRPRRRDLTWWSLSLVVGVIAQALIGAVVVLTHLTPTTVMAHFLASMVLVSCATVLVERAGRPGGPTRAVVAPGLVRLARVVALAGVVAICTGTVVTGTGPHGGDENVERLGFYLPHVARIHGVAVMTFIALLVAFAVRVHRTPAPEVVRHRTEVLVVACVLQAAVGYTQYFNDIPWVLVAVHIVGATTICWAGTRWLMGLRAPVADVSSDPVEAGGLHDDTVTAAPVVAD
jgi:cytochrome c oxidase assembly protein subunit 15